MRRVRGAARVTVLQGRHRAAALAVRKLRAVRRRKDVLLVLRVAARKGVRQPVTPGKLALALAVMHDGAPPYAHGARTLARDLRALAESRGAEQSRPATGGHFTDISGPVDARRGAG